MNEAEFLPINADDMHRRGWTEVDFAYVIGDAYVDHPTFGPAIISRVLEREGYKVGIISQPDWRDISSVKVFGKPRLGFLVSAGNVDSMVAAYTSSKKKRHCDLYSPGGVIGRRPNRAVTVYADLIRKAYKDVAIIAGGIEASLRRLAHYDYWSDSMRKSLLVDSAVDLISYGMGERTIVEIADALNAGLSVSDLTFINGTAFTVKSLDNIVDYIQLPSWDEVSSSGYAYAESFAIQYKNSDSVSAMRLVEQYAPRLFCVQNPPAMPLSTPEMDATYRLPFTYKAHPTYDGAGGVPALSEVEFSITANRGCFGECSFCALSFHQGRVVSTRSKESILDEARNITKRDGFKGYITDIGGPTANFFHPSCDRQSEKGVCSNKRCLGAKPCKLIDADHSEYTDLLKAVREIPGVKKAFVRSGLRYDYALLDKNPEFLKELICHHISGQLRVAPEHVSDDVLTLMGKPMRDVYDQFVERFNKITKKANLEQYVVPYLMSSHPGSTLKDAIELAEFVRDMGFNPEQVQDFYPTPSTLSTVMYCTGYDPLTMKEVYVPRSEDERAMQRALIQYRNPKNHNLVRRALKEAGREDLIGYDKKCLVRPKKTRE